MIFFPILSLATGPAVAAPVVQALDYLLAIPFLLNAARTCRWNPQMANVIAGQVASSACRIERKFLAFSGRLEATC
jgi:hypothetical protein